MSGLLGQLRTPLARRVKLRLAGTDVPALVAKRDRKRLRWLAQETPDEVLRFRALRALAEILDPDAAELFFSLCAAEAGSLPPAVVRTAAEGLGRLLHGDADEHLRRLLLSNRAAGVQLAAARALAALGREQDWQAVRSWATRCATESPLLPDLRDCSAPSVQEPPGTVEIVHVLEVLYADKEAAWWSSKASRWLASDDARPRVASNKGTDRIVAQAHRLLLDRKELDGAEFRRVALHLGVLARERDHEMFVDLLRRQTDATRRRAVVQAIGLHGDPRSIPLLTAWLSEVPDDDAALGAELARATGRLGWPALAPALVALRGRFDDQALRSEVAWALGECGGEAAVRALVDLARSREEQLPDVELGWIARSLKRCGVIGREAIRGSLAIARAGGGERDRIRRLAELAGVQ